MAGHFIDLAVLLAQPQPPSFVLRIVILDLEADDGADPRKGKGHGGDDGAVTQPDDA